MLYQLFLQAKAEKEAAEARAREEVCTYLFLISRVDPDEEAIVNKPNNTIK